MNLSQHTTDRPRARTTLIPVVAIPANDVGESVWMEPLFADLKSSRRLELGVLGDALEARLRAFSPSDPRRPLFDFIDANLRETEAHLSEVTLEARAEFIAEWRARFHPYFLAGASIGRAFRKPLGYAGDYEIMNMAYRNQLEGDSPLGKVLHQWFNASLGANAVRSRRRWILQELQAHGRTWSGTFRVASVASGPALEMRDLVRESFLVHRAELTCIDQDPKSLECAGEGLAAAMDESGSTCSVRLVNQSVKNIISSRAGAERCGAQSFIYTLGLYDYLPERAARALTTALYDQLEPGGRLIIGNYAPHTDVRFAMDLIMDWRLIYRTEEELAQLAADLPADAERRVTAEATGMNLFLVIDKPKLAASVGAPA